MPVKFFQFHTAVYKLRAINQIGSWWLRTTCIKETKWQEKQYLFTHTISKLWDRILFFACFLFLMHIPLTITEYFFLRMLSFSYCNISTGTRERQNKSEKGEWVNCRKTKPKLEIWGHCIQSSVIVSCTEEGDDYSFRVLLQIHGCYFDAVVLFISCSTEVRLWRCR